MFNKISPKFYGLVFPALFVLLGIAAGFVNLSVQKVDGQTDEGEILELDGDYVRRVSLNANDIIFNPQDQMIYASRPSSLGSGGNSISRINPLTGELISSAYVGSEPGKLALSDNGQALYVVLNGAYAVRRFDTINQTAGVQMALGSESGYPFSATDIAVVPGNPDAVAVARYKENNSVGAGVAIFQNGVRLPVVGPGHITGANYLAFSNSPSILYGGGQYFGLRTMTVDANGVTAQPLPDTSFGLGRIKFDGGKLFSSFGQVIDPQARTLLGTFQNAGSNAFVPDSAIGRAFYAVKDSSNNTVSIKAFDINTFLLIGSLTIPNVTGDPVALVRYKSNGLALKTSDNQLFLIQTALIPTAEPLPAPSPTPSVTPIPPTVYQGFTRELSLSAKDLVYNETTGKLYASVTSADAARGNTLTTIDPASGNFENSVFIGSEPGRLALSDNRQTLYVGIDGAGAIRKFDIPTQTAGTQFSLLYGTDGPPRANDIDFMPGSSDTLAVSAVNNSQSLAIYDAGVKRPQSVSFVSGPIELASNSTLYVENNGIEKYSVSLSGVAFQADVASASYGDFKLENGLIYTSNGRVIDTAAQTVIGSFSGVDAHSPLAIDVPNNRAFFITRIGSSGGYYLRAFDLSTFLPVGNLALPLELDTPDALTRWGTNGLAFLTEDGKMYLIQSNLVSPAGGIPTPTPTPSATPTATPANIPTFVRTVPLPANDVVYSAATGALYASVPSVAGSGTGNTITKINPSTGALAASVFIGSEPGKLALSSDAQTLYAKLDGAGSAIRRFDIPTGTPGAQFTPDGDFQPVLDMDVMPGNPQALALASRSNRIAVYENGVRRPSSFPFGVYNVNTIAFADASTVYGYETESSGAGFVKFTVSESGVTGTNLGTNLIRYNSQIEYHNGLIYSTYGRVLNPVTKNIVGTFNTDGTAMAIDAAAKRAFYLKNNVLSAFDTETFVKIGSVTLPYFAGTPTSLVRWGENGLAFRTANSNSYANDSQLYILQSALVAPNSTIPTGIQFELGQYSGSEYFGVVQAVVIRTGDLSTASTVNFATADNTARAGQDYAATSGTLTFAPGEKSKTISVQLINDNVYEGTEDFRLVLTDPAGANATLTYPSSVFLKIDDNENPPQIVSNNLTVTEPVVGASRTAKFTVRLTHPSYQTISVNYWTANGTATAGSDYQAVSGSLTFAPDELYKIVSVPIFGDAVQETNETFYFNLGSAVNGSVGTAQMTATIVNYDPRTARHTPFDFDGDNRSDVAVFRSSNSVWHLNQTEAGYGAVQFGFATDKLVPADYDGDAKTDVAVFRDGVWHILKSSFGYASVQFGLAGDIPVAGDYDGDGFADIAVFRPSDRFWYIWNSSGGVSIFQFGLATDKLVPADYDGDGKTDVAVYRPSNGVWYVQGSLNGFMSGEFGIAADTPVPADYDGDRKADLAVYREGVWYVLQTTNNQVRIAQFGLANDKPAPADYDGDAKTDIAVFREGTWYLDQSSGGIVITQFGLSDDSPVSNAYVP